MTRALHAPGGACSVRVGGHTIERANMDRDTIEQRAADMLHDKRVAVSALVHALTLLPPGANLIAATLDARHVRGLAGETSVCPLAMHLGARVGRPVLVTDGKASVYVCGDWIEVALPDHVQRFVRQFDHGGHAHLAGDPSAGTTGPLPRYRALQST